VGQELISLGADVNSRDSSGRTPLDYTDKWSEGAAAALREKGGVSGDRK
jgi:ankyrin repeat protein